MAQISVHAARSPSAAATCRLGRSGAGFARRGADKTRCGERKRELRLRAAFGARCQLQTVGKAPQMLGPALACAADVDIERHEITTPVRGDRKRHSGLLFVRNGTPDA
jgi:hypothetical protein